MMVVSCVYLSLPKGHGCHGVIPYSAGNRVGTANIPKKNTVVLIEFYLASEWLGYECRLENGLLSYACITIT